MEHKDLIELAKEILVDDLGYFKQEDIVDCSHQCHNIVNPDLYTRDKQYCVEAGKLNLLKLNNKESRFQLLLKEYRNVIWIPFPEVRGKSMIPVIRVYIYSHDFLDYNIEELLSLKNKLLVEIPKLQSQKNNLQNEIYKLEDRLRTFDEIKGKFNYILRGSYGTGVEDNL